MPALMESAASKTMCGLASANACCRRRTSARGMLRSSGTSMWVCLTKNRYQMLALVQPPPVRTYLPLAIDVEMGSGTAVCVQKNQDTY